MKAHALAIGILCEYTLHFDFATPIWSLPWMRIPACTNGINFVNFLNQNK